MRKNTHNNQYYTTMENTKITGNEPYFPTPIAKGNDEVTYSRDTGITIRQKFIMDFLIENRGPVNMAQEAFENYLKIINEPQP